VIPHVDNPVIHYLSNGYSVSIARCITANMIFIKRLVNLLLFRNSKKSVIWVA